MRKCTYISPNMRSRWESYMTLHPIPLNFLIYEENFISFFISVVLVVSFLLHTASPSLSPHQTWDTAPLLSLASTGRNIHLCKPDHFHCSSLWLALDKNKPLQVTCLVFDSAALAVALRHYLRKEKVSLKRE
jgi:hypothetical protein